MSSVYKLNAYEKAYFLMHPHHIMVIKESRGKAYKETTARFGYNSQNDKSDAFRHYFWCALLSKEIGYDKAIMFTNAHEMGESNHRDEKEMDLWNNKIGARIGRTKLLDSMLSIKCMGGGKFLTARVLDSAKRLQSTELHSGPTYPLPVKNYHYQCMEALKSGKLKIINQ